jgi:outer membrane lipoprotein LolB
MPFTVRHDYYAPIRMVTAKLFSLDCSIQAVKLFSCYSLVFFGVLFLLGACSSLPDTPVTEESHNAWARYQAELAEIDSWEMHARSAIFVNQEVYQVGINWQRQQDRFTLLIEAPFGQGVFRVESYPAGGNSEPVMLTMPDGRKYLDDSAENLLDRVFGWSIPVSGLEWWIKGLPQGVADYSFDLRGDGRLKSLLQNGWKVNYLEYFGVQSAAQGLPKKMYLKHQDLAMKIVIERWHQYESQFEAPVLFPEFD